MSKKCLNLTVLVRAMSLLGLLIVLFTFPAPETAAQGGRVISGIIVTPQFELVPNAAIEITSASGTIRAASNKEGSFSIAVPEGELSIAVIEKNISSEPVVIKAGEAPRSLRLEARFVISRVNESVTITDDAMSPDIERRNDAIYENSLFGRDDQMIFTLNAGINAGQHEGGGKSLEVRRFGFNTDHGGVNGGLKIMVDNMPQNQGTQGHGQGYLGDLKSLTPELVKDVSIINGPFSAVYGDFSGLGVVQVQTKETLPDHLRLVFRAARITRSGLSLPTAQNGRTMTAL